MANDNPLPSDHFSLTLRAAMDNPGVLRSESTVHAIDFYGNAETWVVQTARSEDGREVVFLQRNAAEGGMRQVLPPEVTAALSRQREQLVARSRRRAARRGAATRAAKKHGGQR